MSQYTHGHDESVLRAHGARSAEGSAAYLLPHLQPGWRLLDVGCGPGTITTGLAEAVGPGEVIGVDFAEQAVESARAAAAERGDTRTRFEQADVYALPYDDASFDVVHCHQVLHHLTDQVAALREMRRVCRPGGLVAVREVDYAGMVWFPELPGIGRWHETFRALSRSNGAEPDAGRKLRAWARQAGLEDARISSSTWTYASAADTAWWGDSQAARVVRSSFAEQSVERGLATGADLEEMAEAWRTWGADPDACFVMPHVELLATV
jgi:ubiquinone/menaquinone biosynthesis C-methylase UbiE